MQQCTLVETVDKVARLPGISADAVLSSVMRSVAAQLRVASERGDPRAFAQACHRLPTFNDDPNARWRAAESGVAEAIVDALNANRETNSDYHIQSAGCLGLWWLCFPASEDGSALARVSACRSRVVDAGGMVALVSAMQAFNTDQELFGICTQALMYVVEGNPDRKKLVLGHGAKEEWFLLDDS